jgi:alkylation response protein AidB-like acyl-CoA dehydrogenase
MNLYQAPLRDMRFVLHELLNVEQHYASIPAFAGVNRELVDSILDVGARFAEQELSPLNRSGDEEGCHYHDGTVTTPKGFKEAYTKYLDLGLGALSAPLEYGGQSLPPSLDIAVGEMNGTANWSWGMYPGLSRGAIETIKAHGTDAQKGTYLSKMTTGIWTGTMCLTESHAGSDLGLIRTKAIPQDDGSYALQGTKVFISAGEHDMAENIVHIVLARLPDAPKGTKGISLFIVPKYLPDAGGEVGPRNGVHCGGIEHKMGIKASATCVIHFDGAQGFLIGSPNKGLQCMFTFMNAARVGTAVQGVCAAEGAFQGALRYAKERVAMRSLNAPSHPELEADPIIVHPAVRSMLLTQKAFAEGGRALVYWLATQIDLAAQGSTPEVRQQAEDLMSILTPIAKACLTEMGAEAAKHGVQVYGGHGFIREWGMEQIVRDTRIACLYEGTTEIQALDLLGRKVLQTQGELLKKFTRVIHKFCQAHEGKSGMDEFVVPLQSLNKTWGDLTMNIGMKALMNRDEIGGSAVDYIYFSGYVTLAYIWAWMAATARQRLAENPEQATFYQAKVQTAQFYYRKLLPRAQMHVTCIEGGLEAIQQMPNHAFSL